MGYICPSYGEGLPEDTPCPCEMGDDWTTMSRSGFPSYRTTMSKRSSASYWLPRSVRRFPAALRRTM